MHHDLVRFLLVHSKMPIHPTGMTQLPSTQCCEVTSRSTKVDYLMYLDNSNDVLLEPILSCYGNESLLLS
jgi:hypothetical protein